MVVDDNIPSSNPRSRPTVTGETPKTTTTPKQQNKETPKTELNEEKVEKLANSSNQQRNRAGPGTSSATDKGDEKPRPEVKLAEIHEDPLVESNLILKCLYIFMFITFPLVPSPRQGTGPPGPFACL